MSASTVRTAIKNFLTVEAPSETQIDLTVQYAEIKEMIADAGLGGNDSWLGLEFVGNDEVPITVPANNSQGLYRETGTILIHVVGIAKLGIGSELLTRGETLRDLLRGRRIGNITIESVSPMNFGPGTTLQFEGGYMSGTFYATYVSDRHL